VSAQAGPPTSRSLAVPDPATLARWARKGVSAPPRTVLRMAARRATAAVEARRARRLDLARATYLPIEADPGSLLRYVAPALLELPALQRTLLDGAVRHYLDHRFDLLGSGWVMVRHGMACAGLEGHRYSSGNPVQADPAGEWLRARVTAANFTESARIWRLVDAGYEPIDWHLDFKSGWRWSERTWYRDVAYGVVPGADVKVPWELARMQHLPQLALACSSAAAGTDGHESPARYAREFRNEVLDFLATNPPRFGVNWAMSMDVAIRSVNWIVAHDLFLASGVVFDADFESVFRRSVLEHGAHLARNLEWNEEFRGNHYLADLVGLLFVAAYLPRSADVDSWLAFAVQELVAEGASQFSEDGTNFEASTCYHRLSAEMMIHAIALILGLGPQKLDALRDYDPRHLPARPGLRPPPLPLYPTGDGGETPVPDWLLARVERMAEFVVDITKPGGRVPQIGDNDSGRLLKLVPTTLPRTVAEIRRERTNLDHFDGLSDGDTYWDEDHLDHRDVVAAAEALLGRPDFSAFSRDRALVTEFVAGMSSRRTMARSADGPSRSELVRIGSDGQFKAVAAQLDQLPVSRRRQATIVTPRGALPAAPRLIAYPDFGLYLVRSPRIFLAIRCGSVGQNGLGGHAHNDQLGIELVVDGDEWICDPGTYLYTPLPNRRDTYRSADAHFGPKVTGGEPRRLGPGLFALGSSGEATTIYWGPLGFAGRVPMTGGRSVVGVVNWSVDGLQLTYGAEGCFFEGPAENDGNWGGLRSSIPFSPGYGILARIAR
jgi:hypothetical protein